MVLKILDLILQSVCSHRRKRIYHGHGKRTLICRAGEKEVMGGNEEGRREK